MAYGLIAVSAFGLYQFLAGLVLGSAFLVDDWFGRLPRVPGLSYEASYFGTYLLGGIAYFFSRISARADGGNSTLDVIGLLATVAALLASTSRIAIGVAFVVVTLLLVAGRPRRLRRLAVGMGVLATMAVLAVRFFGDVRPGGTSWYTSVEPRLSGAVLMLDIWREDPVLGQGMAYTGGRAWDLTGINVLLELLAGTGVVGFAGFAGFLAALMLAVRRPDAGPVKWALMAQLLALLFNQNLFRMYVWLWIPFLLGRPPGQSTAHRP
jgi:hypothetical protein